MRIRLSTDTYIARTSTVTHTEYLFAGGDEGRVGDDVRLKPRLRQLSQQIQRLLQPPALFARRNDGVICDDVRGHGGRLPLHHVEKRNREVAVYMWHPSAYVSIRQRT